MSFPHTPIRVLTLALLAPTLLAPHWATMDTVRHDMQADGTFQSCTSRVVINDPTVTTVGVKVSSDAGTEELSLVESNAWLHGTAAMKALPTAGPSSVSLTLYDTKSAALLTFSGTLSTSGVLSVAAETVKGEPTLDIDVLAASVFPNAGGYELGLDLSGADTWDVAYATLKTTPCDFTAEKGLCLYDGKRTLSAEVAWDDLGTVWEQELTSCPEGETEVKVKGRDAEGTLRESGKTKLGRVIFTDNDPGDAIDHSSFSSLSIDEDPFTSLSVVEARRYEDSDTVPWEWSDSRAIYLVSSTGWTSGGALPVEASIELSDGSTLLVPVNSYQRAHLGGIGVSGLGSTLTIKGGSISLTDMSLSDLTDSAVCVSGGCFHLVEDGAGDYDLSVSVYAADADLLPDELDLTISVADKGGAILAEDTHTVDFDDEITAVFANELTWTADPVGLDLTGKVSLLDAPNKKGKQKTLAKGKFYGTILVDDSGNLQLNGRDKDSTCGYDTDFVGGETNCDLQFKAGAPLSVKADAPPISPVNHKAAGGPSQATFGLSTLAIYTR